MLSSCSEAAKAGNERRVTSDEDKHRDDGFHPGDLADSDFFTP